MFKKMVAMLSIVALMSGFCFADDTGSYNFGAKTPKNAALRSIVPGWGQQFNGQSTKGYIITGAVVVTLAEAVSLNNKANSTYDDYQNIGVKNDSKYDDYTSQADQAMEVSLLCAAIWIYGIIDAYVVAEKKSAPKEESSAGFTVVSNNGRSSLAFVKKF